MNNTNFNVDQIKGRWTELKGTFKEKWGHLTDNDLTSFEGNFDTLKGKIQQLYGITKEKASQEIDEVLHKLKLTGEDKKDEFAAKANSAVDSAKVKVDQAKTRVDNH